MYTSLAHYSFIGLTNVAINHFPCSPTARFRIPATISKEGFRLTVGSVDRLYCRNLR